MRKIATEISNKVAKFKKKSKKQKQIFAVRSATVFLLLAGIGTAVGIALQRASANFDGDCVNVCISEVSYQNTTMNFDKWASGQNTWAQYLAQTNDGLNPELETPTVPILGTGSNAYSGTTGVRLRINSAIAENLEVYAKLSGEHPLGFNTLATSRTATTNIMGTENAPTAPNNWALTNSNPNDPAEGSLSADTYFQIVFFPFPLPGGSALANNFFSATSTFTITASVKDSPTGVHSLSYKYQATANYMPPLGTLSVCRNADAGSKCVVDIPENMIPIKYGTQTLMPRWVKADKTVAGDWYDYGNRKWANGATLFNEETKYNCNGTPCTPLTYFRDFAAPGEEIPEADIHSFYTYIPRYAYLVQGSGAAGCGNGDVLTYACRRTTAQLFDIAFQSAGEKSLNETGIIGNPFTNDAFTFGDCTTGDDCFSASSIRDASNNDNCDGITCPNGVLELCDPDGDGENTCVDGKRELNGVWYGKFITRNSTLANPRSVPSGSYTEAYNAFGTAFNGTQNIPANQLVDPSNVNAGWNGRILKASDTGAIAYLQVSEYGQGTTRNAATQGNNYFTVAGKLSTTTGNVYGIYDQGYTINNAFELNLAGKNPNGGGLNMATVNPIGNINRNDYYNNYVVATNMNNCTWAECRGQALYETSGSNWFAGSDSLSFDATMWVCRNENSFLSPVRSYFAFGCSSGGYSSFRLSLSRF